MEKSQASTFLIAFSFILLSVVGFHCLQKNEQEQVHHGTYRSLTTNGELSSFGTEEKWIPRAFDQHAIMKTVPKFDTFPTRVLIYDNANDTFVVYNLGHSDVHYPEHTRHCGRCSEPLRLLVDSLKTNFPQRFSPEQPPVQILFRVADSPHTQCMNHPGLCDVSDFAPILSFGSVARDESLIPSEKAYPNRFYVICMYNWKLKGTDTCDWGPIDVDESLEWDSLIPQVVWRGSDFDMLTFLDQFKGMGAPAKAIWPEEGEEVDDVGKTSIVKKIFYQFQRLSPRWRAVAMTLKLEVEIANRMAQRNMTNETEVAAPLPWINCKFFGKETDCHRRYASVGLPVKADEYMGSAEMSKYKYLIDLGGGGGTTWRGTLSKLGMPGLLFHHVTPTTDWFYDEMIPYVHYVPVEWDLSDLKEKFDWAEAHPAEARNISEAATQLYNRLLSENYMSDLYDKLFVQYLGDVANSYVPATPEETVESILQQYKENEFELYKVATCDEKTCSVEVYNDRLRLVS